VLGIVHTLVIPEFRRKRVESLRPAWVILMRPFLRKTNQPTTKQTNAQKVILVIYKAS
jgi:hypothetical protein